jgi:SAM-dependent methyltransferase
MEPQNQLKETVRERYATIARQDKETNESACCGSGCCSAEIETIMSDDYSQLGGYNPDADLGLGCGLPTQFAGIKRGDVIIDLGSGAGNDAFVARHEAGESGKIIGIDFTPAMIEKARKNANARGFNNVEFREGDIENIPASANSADVVVSNCVLNLVPDKDAVFKEIFRVLKSNGHFSISDIVLIGELPEEIKNAAEMYAGCVAGAIQKQAYLQLIQDNGFKNISIQKEKEIKIPDDILLSYLSVEQLKLFKGSGTGVFSITVYAEKPCCDKTTCCQ